MTAVQKVDAGLADVAAGRLISHEVVAEELRRKRIQGIESSLDSDRMNAATFSTGC